MCHGRRLLVHHQALVVRRRIVADGAGDLENDALQEASPGALLDLAVELVAEGAEHVRVRRLLLHVPHDDHVELLRGGVGAERHKLGTDRRKLAAEDVLAAAQPAQKLEAIAVVARPVAEQLVDALDAVERRRRGRGRLAHQLGHVQLHVLATKAPESAGGVGKELADARARLVLPVADEAGRDRGQVQQQLAAADDVARRPLLVLHDDERLGDLLLQRADIRVVGQHDGRDLGQGDLGRSTTVEVGGSPRRRRC